MIAPCIQILHQLMSDINLALGSQQGQKHAKPDLTEDIDKLIGSLAHHGVYVV
jgi:hypothetical protein